MIRDSPQSADWLVQIPLSQLLQLQSSLQEIESLRAENKTLNNRIDGLHKTLYEVIEIIADLKKAVPTSRPA